MARSIDYVDLISIVHDVRAFRQDGDTFFSFQLIGIHGALLIEIDPTMSQHAINKCGFPVIDVSNNGNIPDFLYELFRSLSELCNFGKGIRGVLHK